MNIKCLLRIHTFSKWYVVREKCPAIKLERIYFFRSCIKCGEVEEKGHKYIDMVRNK